MQYKIKDYCDNIKCICNYHITKSISFALHISSSSSLIFLSHFAFFTAKIGQIHDGKLLRSG